MFFDFLSKNYFFMYFHLNLITSLDIWVALEINGLFIDHKINFLIKINCVNKVYTKYIDDNEYFKFSLARKKKIVSPIFDYWKICSYRSERYNK